MIPAVRLILAWFHLLALAIGMGAVWARGHTLRDVARTGDPSSPVARTALRAAFRADGFWGGAAALWLVTGLARAFGPFEKGTTYYFSNHWFLTKMVLFLVILALELSPMLALIRWRRASARGAPIDVSKAAAFARISSVQAALLVVMVLLATAMARGYGAPHR
jgi:putative membrane protein